MKFIPFSDPVEASMKKYGIIVGIMAMYLVFMKDPPERISKITDSIYVKLLTLFVIAFKSTKDVEIALVSMLLLVVVINVLKTPEEKKASGNFLSL